MKTTRYNTIARITNKAYMTVLAVVLGLSFASCSNSDEPSGAPDNSKTVTAAQVTFTYTVPEELFNYAEITVCYNNNAGTDAEWQPMLDNKFTVTYNLTKFPVTAPVVLIYDKTNRLKGGIDVDWDITMDMEVTLTQDGQKITKTKSETFKIDGDLGAAITSLQRNVVDRTYAVKIAKSGEVNFVH